MNTPIESPRVPRRRRMIASLAAAAVLLAACGSDADDDAAADTTEAAADSDADATSDDSGEGSGSDDLQQNGPITIEGDPLADYDRNSDDVTVGTPAPVVSGESFDGTPMTIGGPTENPTMVVFLAHWCPHCNDEIPELLELEEAGSIPADLDVIAVSTSVDEGAPNYPPSEWLVEKGWPWPAMADDADVSAIKAFGGTAFPFVAIVDADGNVLARRAGSATADATLEFINEALA